MLLLGTAAQAGVSVQLTTPTPTIATGDSFFVVAQINTAASAFNAFDLHVYFDASLVSLVVASPISDQLGALMTAACANNYHLFNPDPDSATAHVTMLCNSSASVTGPGAIYRLKFRSNGRPGNATFSMGASTQFFFAGLFVRPVVASGVTVQIDGPTRGERHSLGELKSRFRAPHSPR